MIKKILFFLLPLLIFGCLPKEDDRAKRKKEIDLKVAEQIANFTKIRKENCRKSILKEAGKIVDSLLILEARARVDSINKPPIPSKPIKPELREVKDSTAIAPFFKDSTLKLKQ